MCAFCHSNDDSRHPRFRHRKATAQHGQNTQPKGTQQKPSVAKVSSGRKNGTAAVGELPRPPSTVATDYDDMSLPALKPISTFTTPTAHSAKHKNSGIGVSDGWTQKQNGKTVQKSAEHVRQGGKGGGGDNDFGSVGKDATTTGTRVHSRDSKSKTNNSYSNSNNANHHQGFFAHLEEEDEVDVDDNDDDGFTTVGGHLKKNGKLKTGTTSNGGKKHHMESTATTATAKVKQVAIATSQPPLPKMSSLQHNDGDMVTTKTAAGVVPSTVVPAAVAPAVIAPSAFTVSTPVDAKIPVEYLCRLSKQLMNDPVICADGETYEKTVIEEWIQEHTKMKKKLISPVTGEEMQHPFLTPNFSIKTLIVAFRESTMSA